MTLTGIVPLDQRKGTTEPTYGKKQGTFYGVY